MKNKKGFSLIEILFVLGVMSALAAIAIPSYLEDKESLILTKIRVDTTNALNTIHNQYEMTNSFESIYGNGYSSNAGTNGEYATGESATATINGTKFSLTEGNSISLNNSSYIAEDCPEGFVLTISNYDIMKMSYFDSCKDTKFKILPITGS